MAGISKNNDNFACRIQFIENNADDNLQK
jgi:hypothetical protein